MLPQIFWPGTASAWPVDNCMVMAWLSRVSMCACAHDTVTPPSRLALTPPSLSGSRDPVELPPGNAGNGGACGRCARTALQRCI